MSGQLVLLTGATGHVGYEVLIRTLDAGYKVRAAVRSQAKADSLLSHPNIQSRNAGGSRLSTIIVPDLTLPGAYDEAVQGVSYVIHVASPLVNEAWKPEEYKANLIEPAVRGTIGILESAHKASSVKRVVITSSAVAIVPFMALLQGSDKDTFDSENRLEDPDVSEMAHPMQLYVASKVLALNAAERWVRTEKPAFDVVHLMPSYIYGRDEFLDTPARLLGHGTNRMVLSVVLGQKDDQGATGSTVHVNDVARAHVLALDTAKVPGNTGYLLNNAAVFDDAKAVAAKYFPEAVASGKLPNNGTRPTLPFKSDTSKTEKTFGFTHASYEQQAKDVIAQYLEVLAK